MKAERGSASTSLDSRRTLALAPSTIASEVSRINNNPGVNALSPSTFPIDPGSTLSRTTPGDPLRNMFQNELWPGTNFDAVEQFAQPRPFWQQNLDLRGRAGNTSYYASGNVFNQGGAIQFLDGFQRQSARLNVDHAINDWTFALSSYYARDRKDGFDQEDGGGAFFRLTRTPPIANLEQRDQFGRLFIRTNLQGGGTQNYNPLYYLENQRTTDRTATDLSVARRHSGARSSGRRWISTSPMTARTRQPISSATRVSATPPAPRQL